MKSTITISGRRIGYQERPFVIAEIGINHEGSLETAKLMVDAAKNAGAECIKHQTHIVDDEMSPAARQVIPGNAKESIYDIMCRCALSAEDEWALKVYTEQQGLIFISTPFGRAAADRLEEFGVPAYKIGSGECNNYPLIEHVASFGKPMIVSTGMNTLESVGKTVSILKSYGVDFALLHTTNLYPTPPQLVRLGAMQQLMESFPGIPVGLSDHTTNNLACFAAAALGACIFERHFTDSMSRTGPDIVNSMDGGALSELQSGCEQIQMMRGGNKVPAKEEQVTMDFAFATVVAIGDIEPGAVFTKDNIWVKRPGIGEISAECYPDVLGKICVHGAKSGSHLEWSNVAG